MHAATCCRAPHFDLAPRDRLLDHDVIVVAKCFFDRGDELSAIVRLRHPDRRAEVRRLDEQGQSEIVDDIVGNDAVTWCSRTARHRGWATRAGRPCPWRPTCPCTAPTRARPRRRRERPPVPAAPHGAVFTHRTVQQREHHHRLGALRGGHDGRQGIEFGSVAVVGRRQRAGPRRRERRPRRSTRPNALRG